MNALRDFLREEDTSVNFSLTSQQMDTGTHDVARTRFRFSMRPWRPNSRRDGDPFRKIMNSSSTCHEIPDCPGLFVDAFRGHYLKVATSPKHSSSQFILTHYHGDHYGSLPKDGKYLGPAKIHCTPVTAALLRQVHGIPKELVVEHAYGESWAYSYANKKCTPSPGASRKRTAAGVLAQNKKGDSAVEQTETATLTFYDAHHCPGAAMLLIQLNKSTHHGNSTGFTCDKTPVIYHLHTGDMRYHESMKSYPLLKKAVETRTLDCVFLDTTYGGNPKHDFLSQDAAIDSIASQVQDLLQVGNDAPRGEQTAGAQDTLVLLSCYSIGKEKVVWESAFRSNQQVYVSERKLRMIECLQGYIYQNGGCGDEDFTTQLLHRCTCNAEQSDLHVIPMGMAGELWPFFQPNYKACAEYANNLKHKTYKRVVAFIPTGWAESSNWNKKNAINRCTNWGLDIEIRLFPYSEHSSFSELQAFVSYLKPRKIIPTVFKDENEKRKIEARFKIDSNRAKAHFFKSMTNLSTKEPNAQSQVIDLSGPDTCTLKQSPELNLIHEEGSTYAEHVSYLEAMGFDLNNAQQALCASGGSISSAIELLLANDKMPSGNNQTFGEKGDQVDTKSRHSEQKSKPPQSIAAFFTKTAKKIRKKGC